MAIHPICPICHECWASIIAKIYHMMCVYVYILAALAPHSAFRYTAYGIHMILYILPIGWFAKKLQNGLRLRNTLAIRPLDKDY